MIIIDGQQSQFAIANFANLEELLVSVTQTETMSDRIVTDVFVNDEQFSELYPHQSEDIETSEIEKVEIISVLNSQMAVSITKELHKVNLIMQASTRQVAEGLRELNNDALNLLVDTVNVTRDFMSMIAVLRSEFIDTVDEEFTEHVESISQLLAEINEVLESEDWFLLADLLEFEFLPACQGWESILINIEKQIDSKH